MITKLQKKNKDIPIYPIHDERFASYGRILASEPYKKVFQYMDEYISIPNEGNNYVAHDEQFARMFTGIDYSEVFPNKDVEYGYVCGHNQKLNALEYHKSSEINIAVTPFVLMLGLPKKMVGQTYHSKDVEVFFVPKGTVFELHPEILHFSPCKVEDKGFKCGVVLPYETNMHFEQRSEVVQTNDDLLFKTNKWLLCHEDFERFVSLGAHVGLIGPNYEIRY